MTGCGKSSVGKVLAKKLGARLVDLDDVIAERHGSIKELFAKQGESAFRQLECEALRDVINECRGEMTILSCGGGVPTYKQSYELLSKSTTVIWLRRSADSLSADSQVLSRPPLNGSIEVYKRLHAERYPIYKSLAHYTFYNVFPQRTATEIIKKLELVEPENLK